MSSLFRDEALEHQQHKVYGTILLARPWSYTVLTGLFVTIVVAIVLFFFLFGFSRKEIVAGVLLPERGLVRVYPQETGIVIQANVTDGQLVSAGDVLFVMSGERASSAKGDTQTVIGQTLSSRISRLRLELEQQRQQTRLQESNLEKRRVALNGQLKQIESEIALQKKRVEIAEAAVQRQQELRKSNFISEAQLQDQTAAALDQQSKLSNLERARSALIVDIATADADLRDLPLRSQRDASVMQREIAELEQSVAQNEAQREFVVRAAQAGRVTAVTAVRGQMVATNHVMAIVLPTNEKLEAELYAPTRAIGFIKPGTKVVLRYHAFPFQKFGQYQGVVREVARSAMQPNEISTDAIKMTEPVYRIRATLDDQAVMAYGKQEALVAGMQLEASLVLEYRKLYEWIIEPLYSVTGRI